MANTRRARGILGGPVEKKIHVKATPKLLKELGECLVKIIVLEAKKDFAKRGWSGEDPMGGSPIWESFSYQIRGKSTLEILSSYYGLPELLEGVPKRDMPWLTQAHKRLQPAVHKLTPKERELGMKKTGQPARGERLPLVVPIKVGNTVIFRTAPLKFQDAWVHPGIARFTFMERAIRKGREECARILGAEAVRQIFEGLK